MNKLEIKPVMYGLQWGERGISSLACFNNYSSAAVYLSKCDNNIDGKIVELYDEKVKDTLDMAIWRIQDMLMNDDGQAFKEARKFLEGLGVEV